MKTNIILSLISLAAFVLIPGCVNDPQDIAPITAHEPVFYADLQIDQEHIEFTAGEDSYILQTEHFTDEEGVTHYVSTFTSENCQDQFCPTLEFEFFDNQLLSHPESGVEHTFVTGNKPFYNSELDGELEITFLLGQGGFGPGAWWTSGMDTTPINESQIQINASPSEYFDLCFHREGEDGCQGLASYCFHTLASSPFVGVLKADRNFEEYVVIEMDLAGTAPYSYKWMNGAETEFILIPAVDGEVEVSVTATDATLSEIEVSQTIHIEDGDAEMCGGSPQFLYTISKAPFSQFSTVIVRYTDANGKLYSSAFGVQSSGVFDIRDVRNYHVSPQGDPTKLLEVILNGTLYSADGAEAVDISGTDIVFAIAY